MLGTVWVSSMFYRVISKPMVQCSNEECRRDIDDNWSFCPYCGLDRRRDYNGEPVFHRDHKFVTGGDFCIGCGGRYGDQYFDVPEFARKLGWSTFAVGAAILVVACLIWLIHATHGPGFDSISSWYDDGKVYLGAGGNAFRAKAGPPIIEWMLAIGAIIAVAGFAAARTKRPQYYSGEYIK